MILAFRYCRARFGGCDPASMTAAPLGTLTYGAFSCPQVDPASYPFPHNREDPVSQTRCPSQVRTPILLEYSPCPHDVGEGRIGPMILPGECKDAPKCTADLGPSRAWLPCGGSAGHRFPPIMVGGVAVNGSIRDEAIRGHGDESAWVSGLPGAPIAPDEDGADPAVGASGPPAADPGSSRSFRTAVSNWASGRDRLLADGEDPHARAEGRPEMPDCR